MRTYPVLLVGLSFVASAGADHLWDQSDVDTSVIALIDQEFPDFPCYSSYMVMDVQAGDPGLTISQVTTYFTNTAGSWGPGITRARLNVFEKTGSRPSDDVDPSMGMEVPVRCRPGLYGWEVTASGLEIYIHGDYWIGLTPIAEYFTYGQEFHQAAPIVGEDTAWRNPAGGFGWGSVWTRASVLDGSWAGTWDAAFCIVPEPSSVVLFGLGAWAVLRRR